MSNKFTIWLIVLGTCMACFNTILESQKVNTISISVETTSEINEKSDTDDGIIPRIQVMFFALPIEVINSYFVKLVCLYITPEPRPPRAAFLFNTIKE